MKKIFLIVFLILLSAPFLVDAQGLVPCGGENQSPCEFCHFFVLFDNIIKFLLIPDSLNSYAPIVPLIAVLMIVIAGVYYFTAAGDPGKITKATGVLKTIIIGLIIIYGAWLFINVFFAFIGLSEFALKLTGPGEWFIINCPVTP